MAAAWACALSAAILDGQVGHRMDGAPWWAGFTLAALATLTMCLRIVFPQDSADRLAWWRDRRRARRRNPARTARQRGNGRTYRQPPIGPTACRNAETLGRTGPAPGFPDTPASPHPGSLRDAIGTRYRFCQGAKRAGRARSRRKLG